MPKMSEELVEFAAPLLDDLPDDAGAAEWHSQLLLAATVWNMSCAADERRLEADGHAAGELRRELINRLERATEWPRPQCESLVSELETRKRTLFADDPRFIMDVQTVDTEDGVHVFTASRL